MALKRLGVESVVVVAPSIEHAFDIWAKVGEKVDVEILSPAVSCGICCLGRGC